VQLRNFVQSVIFALAAAAKTADAESQSGLSDDGRPRRYSSQTPQTISDSTCQQMTGPLNKQAENNILSDWKDNQSRH
jgi:hypothetical protein